ncbi:formate dehydrogenase accessory sulfurtransferase FdhD [Actinotalea sp. AC32]|nr:formate dehydrogenase accessory sulfurtransferase FdhD [Actinotalea sp. AC32]
MRLTRRWRVQRMTASGPVRDRVDALAGEEPLEVRVHGTPFTVTMRTPGADVDLVAGFLVSEGVVRAADDIASVDHRAGIGSAGERDYNVVDVRLAPGVALPDPSLQRHVYTSSSCGVCGTASIEAVRKVGAFDLTTDVAVVRLDHLLALPDRLREEQTLFGRTGGVHAAALFVPDDDAAPGGAPRLACVREDVGRHNAVDKVVGWALRDGLLPLRGAVLQVSGRASFELVQKAAMAGVPVLSAVSAPSALAVELADELGLTLVAFNRGETLNAYTHAHRLRAVPAAPGS